MHDPGRTDNQSIGPRERAVLMTLLKFTLGMVLLPISGFFISKRMVFEGLLGYDNGGIGGAIITVIIVHIIIFMYIRIAIQEDQPTTEKKLG